MLQLQLAYVADQIHEIAVGAFIVLEEWELALAALQRVSRRHLASEKVASLSLKLLENYRRSVGDSATTKAAADFEQRLVLMQPLPLLPLRSRLLGECLLVLSSSLQPQLLSRVGEVCEKILALDVTLAPTGSER